MGERGPLPIPYARRRNKRPVLANKVPVARPSMPRTLAGEARAEWQRIVPQLELMGIVSTVDRAVLIRYCTAWADWCDLDRLLRASGLLIQGRRDALVRNPLTLLRSEAERTLAELGKELGLTPNARLRAGLKHEQPKQDEGEARVKAIADYRKRLEG